MKYASEKRTCFFLVHYFAILYIANNKMDAKVDQVRSAFVNVMNLSELVNSQGATVEYRRRKGRS